MTRIVIWQIIAVIVGAVLGTCLPGCLSTRLIGYDEHVADPNVTVTATRNGRPVGDAGP